MMLFGRTNASSEIATEMDRLVKVAEVGVQTEALTKLSSAIDKLDEAAKEFEALGLETEADEAVSMIERFAKKKPTKKSPKSDKATKGLSSKKQVENLAHVGWVFNAPADDGKTDKNDMKMGIAGSEVFGHDSASYWKARAQVFIKNNDLDKAQKCLDQAKAMELFERKLDEEAVDSKEESVPEIMDVPSKKELLKADDKNDAKPLVNEAEMWEKEAKRLYDMAMSEKDAGRVVFAKWFLEKAREMAAKAHELKGRVEESELNKDLLNAKDDAEWGKDELEQDLARGMYELEDTDGPRHSPFSLDEAWTDPNMEDWDKSSEWEDEDFRL
jgi:hypothetical protein